MHRLRPFAHTSSYSHTSMLRVVPQTFASMRFIMALTDGSQSTGLVSCILSSSTICFGGVPAETGWAVAFMYTVEEGGLILGNIASSSLPNFSLADAISSVWKPPEVFRTLA